MLHNPVSPNTYGPWKTSNEVDNEQSQCLCDVLSLPVVVDLLEETDRADLSVEMVTATCD